MWTIEGMAKTGTFPNAQWFGLDEKNKIIPLKDGKESDRWWARNERRANVRVTKVKGRVVWTRFNGAMLDPGFLAHPPKRCISGVGRVGGAPPIIAIIAS